MTFSAPDHSRSDDLLWCHDAVRRGDRDRFLCSLFAAPVNRPPLWALYALNLELAHIREAVTDPLPGQIRLQWWREAISAAYTGTARAHPVVRLVAATLPGRLPEAGLQALIDARAADVAAGGPTTLPALQAYLVATAGRLQALAAAALTAGDAPASATATAAEAAGTAWGLVGMIRAVAFQAHSSQLILPRAEMKAAGVREADVLQHKMSAELGQLIARMAAEAEAHIKAAHDLAGSVHPAALPALLPCVLAEGYLLRLRACGWNPFALRGAQPTARMLVRLWWQGRRGRF